MSRSRDYNLVVATGWRQERRCIEELYRAGDLLGIRVRHVWFTGFDGLLTAEVDGDPVEFARGLTSMVESGYYVPRFILKAIPIMVVVETDLDAIADAASKLAVERIAEGETYRIELRKRGVAFDRMSIIDYVARRIPRKVRLRDPDKLVLIDMFPSRTGVSVLREEDIFTLLKAVARVQGEEGGQ